MSAAGKAQKKDRKKKLSANKWYQLIPIIKNGESQEHGSERSASVESGSKHERNSPATTSSTSIRGDTLRMSAGPRPSTRLTTPDHDYFAQADDSDCGAPAGTYEVKVEIEDMNQYQPSEHLAQIDRSKRVNNTRRNDSGLYKKRGCGCLRSDIDYVLIGA